MSIIEGDLAAHLQRPDTWYDVLVVSRPHNFDYVWPAVRTHQPWAQLIYDCEAMWWRRLARQAELTTDPEAAGRLRAEAALMQTIEVRNVRASDVVVTVSEDESSLVRQIGVDERNVFALAPIESGVSPTTHGFHARRDIGLVAGWMAGLASPNADGLHWFIDHVLPVIRSRIPWVRLRVTGRNPPVELLAMSDPNLSFEGHVSDLARFYEQVRVVVSPMRFGSGVKLKTVQAIQYAVPTVATSIGAEGLTLASSAGLYVSDDPSVFADAVTRLLTDEHEWERSRAALFTCIEAWSSARATESWPRLVNELSARRVNGSDATSARH
jgi:glycosyltransferase involved in cell wall biosynthesis